VAVRGTEWKDKAVVITGASRGIGRAVAVAAGQRGARLGLVARTGPDLEAVLAEGGGRGAVAVADVGDRQQITRAIGDLEATLGRIDVLVANAGIGLYGPFAACDLDDADRLVRVNVLGTLYAVRSALPGMIERHQGHVVVLGSIAGRLGAPFEAVYSATKFAQTGFAEALSVEVAPLGIGVSLISPGPVSTEFFAARGHAYDRGFPKPVSPERVARVVLRAVDGERADQHVPRWLRSALVIRHLVPPLYRTGTARSFKAQTTQTAHTNGG
jgi:short-subunit dehydrogenase